MRSPCPTRELRSLGFTGAVTSRYLGTSSRNARPGVNHAIRRAVCPSRWQIALFTVIAIVAADCLMASERAVVARVWIRPADLAPPPLGRPTNSDAEPNPTGCGLLAAGSDAALSSDCLACHGSLAYHGHPYDLDLRLWHQTSRGSALRPLDEMLRRGAFLPDGQLRCVTCHHGLSPWKFHIRLPAGSKPTHAVDRQRKETYEWPERLPPPRAGDDVGRKPLCLACHAMD